MLALRFDGEPKLEEIDVPEPGPGEALIRLRRAGICSTDLEIVRGYMGFTGTLGHEFVGEVIEGDGLVGKRVTGEINLACTECDRCRRGLGRHCANRTVLGILGKDGCFAEYLTLPLLNLHVVPDAVSDENAAFVEPLAAAFEILEQVQVDPSAHVAVLGDGKLGSLVAMVLQQTGARVTVVGRHADKLNRLAALAIETTLAKDAEVDGCDIVVEATGLAEGFETARAMLRPRGTLVLKSTYHGKLELHAAPLVIDEITVVGSRCGPFAPALRALASKQINPGPLLKTEYALEDEIEALARAGERGVRKVQLVHGG